MTKYAHMNIIVKVPLISEMPPNLYLPSEIFDVRISFLSFASPFCCSVFLFFGLRERTVSLLHSQIALPFLPFLLISKERFVFYHFPVLVSLMLEFPF